MVTDKAMPGGEYVISNFDHKVMIEDGQAKPLAMVLANSVGGRTPRQTGQVVFQCYARQCFLSEVWAPGQEVGRQLLRSCVEIGVAQHERPTYFALLGGK